MLASAGHSRVLTEPFSELAAGEGLRIVECAERDLFINPLHQRFDELSIAGRILQRGVLSTAHSAVSKVQIQISGLRSHTNVTHCRLSDRWPWGWRAPDAPSAFACRAQWLPRCRGFSVLRMAGNSERPPEGPSLSGG